jgi:DNA/RNA-binding domain of Phe-tRNA-synthetase-like protein
MISIEDEIRQKIPHLKLAIVACQVKNSDYDHDLWQQIKEKSEQIRQESDFDQIKNQDNIKACKDAYRALGKDPNRYRPSAESLRRRIVSSAGTKTVYPPSGS